MFNKRTIYANFTPIVKAPVIGYRISGDDVLNILLHAGANPLNENSNGDTVFLLARKMKSFSILDKILSFNSNNTDKNHEEMGTYNVHRQI